MAEKLADGIATLEAAGLRVVAADLDAPAIYTVPTTRQTMDATAEVLASGVCSDHPHPREDVVGGEGESDDVLRQEPERWDGQS